MNRFPRCLNFTLVIVCAVFGLAAVARAEVNEKVVRLAIVNTPKISGLIDALVQDFQSSSGMTVEVYAGNDVYERARAGQADLVISHYGKGDVERFVLDGFGAWPKTVFSNQLVIAGPKSDPAQIKGLSSATQAMSRIAKANAPFVANELPSITYLTNILLEGAGLTEKGAWFLEAGVSKGLAIQYAADKQAYVIWGAIPFLRFQSKHSTDMEVMVSADPMLERVMVAVAVKPDKVAGVNVKGAEALTAFLLTPKIQAKIAAYRSPESGLQFWWPAGRSNSSDGLDE